MKHFLDLDRRACGTAFRADFFISPYCPYFLLIQ
jgi:hypothetical protein